MGLRAKLFSSEGGEIKQQGEYSIGYGKQPRGGYKRRARLWLSFKSMEKEMLLFSVS